MTLPDRNRSALEVGDELIRVIGEVDSVWEVHALSLDPNEIIKLARAVGGNSIYINIDEDYSNPTAGSKPKRDITFNFEIMCFVHIGTDAEQALRESNGAMPLAKVVRDKLNSVILFADLNDDKFLPTPIALENSDYEVVDKSFVVGIVPGSCTTTYFGGHVVASTAGSGFPSSPSEGDQHYHTGFGAAFRRHFGIIEQWLSEFREPFGFLGIGAHSDLQPIPWSSTQLTLELPYPAVIVGGLIKQSAGSPNAFDLEILVEGVVKKTIAFDTGNPSKSTVFDFDSSLVSVALGDSISCRINNTGATKPSNPVVSLSIKEARP